jgi:hypothetical protein
MHLDRYVFHYTGASALLSIVTKRELWATDLAYLNDRNEGTLLSKLVEQMLTTSALAPDVHKRLTPTFEEAIQAYMGSHRHNACVSFSRNYDSLTQFRMYCPPAGGFAIGFPRAVIQRVGHMTSCNYDGDETRHWVIHHLHQLLDYLGEQPSGLAADVLGNALIQHAGFDDLRTEATLRFKSREFAQEEEERLCIHEWASCFRPSREENAIIPYTVVKVPNEPFEVKIVVGPSRDPDWAQWTPASVFRAAGLAGTRWQFGHLAAGAFGFRAG